MYQKDIGWHIVYYFYLQNIIQDNLKKDQHFCICKLDWDYIHSYQEDIIKHKHLFL